MSVVRVVALFACVLVLPSLVAAADAQVAPDIEIFGRAGCGRCAEAERFLAELRAEQPGLRIASHDVVADAAALERLRALENGRGMRTLVVPAFLVRGELVVGFRRDVSERVIRSRLQSPESGRLPTPVPSGT